MAVPIAGLSVLLKAEGLNEVVGAVKKVQGHVQKGYGIVKNTIDKVTGSFKKNTMQFMASAGASLGFLHMIAKTSGVVSAYMEEFWSALGLVGDIITLSLAPMFEVLIDLIIRFAEWIDKQPEGLKLFLGAFIAIGLMLPIITVLIGSFMALLNPLTVLLVILAGVGLILWKAWEENWGNIRGLVGEVIGYLMKIFDWVVKEGMALWGDFKDFMKEIFPVVVGLIRDELIPALKELYDFWKDDFSEIYNTVIKPIFKAIAYLITSGLIAVFLGLVLTVVAVFMTIMTVIGTAWRFIKFALWSIRLAFKTMVYVMKTVWETTLKPVFSAIKTAFKSMAEGMKTIWDTILKPIWDAIVGGAKTVMDILGAVGGGIASTITSILPSFQHGGVMPHTGLAHLHAGETIVPAGATHYGGITVHVDVGSISSEIDVRRLAVIVAEEIDSRIRRM